MNPQEAVREFLTYIDAERGLAASTQKAYRLQIRRYLRSLETRGVKQVAEITASMVVDALNDLGEQTESIYSQWLAAVRLFHRLALREGWAASNPAELIDGPLRGRGLPKPMAVETVTAIIEAANDVSPLGLRNRAIFELLYASGVRASELVGLNLGDADLENRQLRVFGKGQKERVVPFGRKAAEALTLYLEKGRPALLRERSDALFLNPRGGRLSRGGLWRLVKQQAAKVTAGERVYPHRFRHSTATHLLDRQADIRVVQELLGHARLSTTQQYTAVTPRRLQYVIETFHPRGRRKEQPGETETPHTEAIGTPRIGDS